MTRRMCMWPERFEEPVRSLKDIHAIKGTPEYARKSAVPIKATPHDTSLLYFKDPLTQKFAKMIVKDSNGMLAEEIMIKLYTRIKSIQLAKARSAKDPTSVVTDPTVIIAEAIENARPIMRLERVKVGAIQYMVPTPITERRSYFEGMRWIHLSARDERNNPRWIGRLKNPDEPVARSTKIEEALAKEILDAYAFTGKAINKKIEYHRICEQNRAFAHYRRTK